MSEGGRNMPVLHLDNVPEELYQQIEELAQEHHQSPTNEALDLLEDAVRRQKKSERLNVAAMLEEIKRTRYPLAPGTPDSVEMLREDRNR
jgi:antitoxin FitA